MTDSTIDGKFLTFKDGWPEGEVLYGIPQDGFNGATHHNVSTPAYPVGTKIRVWDNNDASKGRQGWATFIYLRVGTAGTTATLAAKDFVVPEAFAALTADANGLYRVTNDSDGSSHMGTGSPMVAIAIGAMTDLYYGWFQCGGTPAANLVTSASSYCLDGTFKTNGAVTAGKPFQIVGSASERIKLGLYQGLTASMQPCGYAMAADT